MTRAGFFKLLAAVGLGQQTHTTLECNPKKDLDECKQGEERCPLSHCQKPSASLWAVPVDKEAYNKAQVELMSYYGPWVTPHVCSTCGIVYVPVSKP